MREHFSNFRDAMLERTGGKTLPQALVFALQYAGLRGWALLIGLFPIDWSLQTARWLGRTWFYFPLLRRHRERAVTHLRAAFGDTYNDAEIERVARASFEHFAQVYLVEA